MMARTLHIKNMQLIFEWLKSVNSLKGVSKMILDKVLAKKNNAADKNQKHSRALSLLLDDMAVWFPFPYYNVEAMLYEETKGFKANRSSKIRPSDLLA